VSGRISEQWNGLDESGSIFVPDLPSFVVAIAATPLPECSILTYGNRAMRFLDYAPSRRGVSLFSLRDGAHGHHAGLSALDDVSPPLVIRPLNAQWSASERLWLLSEPTLRLGLAVEGPASETFAKQPATVYHFVDSHPVGRSTVKRGQAEPMIIAASKLGSGIAMVSVNWRSDYGGVAANSLRVRVIKQAESAHLATRGRDR
jgi:hypothetical protein